MNYKNFEETNPRVADALADSKNHPIVFVGAGLFLRQHSDSQYETVLYAVTE